jgi:hypothetical protein
MSSWGLRGQGQRAGGGGRKLRPGVQTSFPVVYGVLSSGCRFSAACTTSLGHNLRIGTQSTVTGSLHGAGCGMSPTCHRCESGGGEAKLLAPVLRDSFGGMA